MRKLLYFLLLPLFAFTACSDDDDSAEEQLKKDIALIQEYLIENNLVAESTESGLHYIIDEQGTGAKPSLSSLVDVEYEGRLLENNEVFGEGRIARQLSYLIKGWQEGLPFFNEGGSGKLLIPSALGYGDMQQDNIPPNSVLIYDIQLILVVD